MNATLFLSCFKLGTKLSSQVRLKVEVAGGLLFFTIWLLLTEGGLVPPTILPSPLKVAAAVPEMFLKNNLFRHLGYSLLLNFLGYLEAVMIAVPLGFLIGLYAPPRAVSERLLTAMRFLPLTAVMPIMILWFGISHGMKVHFLALGILVYLLPVIVQRIDEVSPVYMDMAKTLGARDWQKIRTITMPYVFSRVSDDIRVLVAISWTYIVIAEAVNLDEGGLGAMIARSDRQSRPDKTFALVIIILVVGFIQDKVWLALDKKRFPHKYV